MAACGGGSCGAQEKLSPQEVAKRLPELTLWGLDAAGERISRSFVAKNFKAALAFVTTAGQVAEEQRHHPDLHITAYRTVTVEIYTHTVGGLTEGDFILARLLDQIPVGMTAALRGCLPTLI
eukprot:gene11641-2117_t